MTASLSPRTSDLRPWHIVISSGFAGLACHLILWLSLQQYRYSLGLAIPNGLTETLGASRGYHEIADLPVMLAESSLIFGGLAWVVVGAALAFVWVRANKRTKRN